jgi:hypothetical protein
MMMQKERLKLGLIEYDQSIFNQMYKILESDGSENLLDVLANSLKSEPSRQGEVNGISKVFI